MSKRFKSARSSDTSACALHSNPAQRARVPMPRVESERRELARRSNDGIDVALNWHPALDELTVCVRDQRHGAYFEIRPQRHWHSTSTTTPTPTPTSRTCTKGRTGWPPRSTWSGSSQNLR
jgi:hypothetical protein